MGGEATMEDFDRLRFRVGTVVDAQPFPEACKPSFKLWIDFGAGVGIKTSAAQLTIHYAVDQLIGRQVCAVVNLPLRSAAVAGFTSEAMVLVLPDADGALVLVRPDLAVPNGGRLF